MGIDVPAGALERLMAFVELLLKWNATYNLTAIRTPDDVVSHHLLDSIAVLPLLDDLAPPQSPPHENSALATRRSWHLADVGSGAGLPGLVLALLRPDWRIVSVEAVAKKAAFQRQACIELGLGNVEVKSQRVEGLPSGGFDAVISRAFAELAQFARLAGHLLNPCGHLLAMKGVLPRDEMEKLPEPWRVSRALPLAVPGLDASRHLIVLEKA